jgi:hypothetical protein
MRKILKKEVLIKAGLLYLLPLGTVFAGSYLLYVLVAK